MVSLLLSPGEACVSWVKGKGGGIPRARRDKDLKGAERMERKRGDQPSIGTSKGSRGARWGRS